MLCLIAHSLFRWRWSTIHSTSNGTIISYQPLMTQLVLIIFKLLRSICFHPSLLPRHRGASAISWTLIEGDTTGGFSIFYPDSGLDTGNLLLTRFEYTIIIGCDSICRIAHVSLSVSQWHFFRVREILLVTWECDWHDGHVDQWEDIMTNQRVWWPIKGHDDQ